MQNNLRKEMAPIGGRHYQVGLCDNCGHNYYSFIYVCNVKTSFVIEIFLSGGKKFLVNPKSRLIQIDFHIVSKYKIADFLGKHFFCFFAKEIVKISASLGLAALCNSDLDLFSHRQKE